MNPNKSINLLIALFLIILTSNLIAQSNGEKVLKSLQNKFESINDLTVDVIQKSGGKEVLSGKLSFRKENKFSLDLKNNLIVSDGETIWNYNKKDNKVIINTVDESTPSFFSFNTFVYDYPAKCNVTTEENGKILLFTPKSNSDLNFNKARLRVNNKDLVDKVILEGSDAGQIEVDFSNYKLNQNLSDSKFQFTPPEGSSIIDLR
jgi:chaperone LolA